MFIQRSPSPILLVTDIVDSGEISTVFSPMGSTSKREGEIEFWWVLPIPREEQGRGRRRRRRRKGGRGDP